MNESSILNSKQFFRFTGPPEHWLTAIKYMTWGLEIDKLSRWQKIQTGDVFFIHSTGSANAAFPNAKSGIIGIGVVGFHFSKKDNFLWYSEIEKRENRWPLLVPLSEIYLFSELPDPESWESPQPGNEQTATALIDQLLANRIPVKHLAGFPVMGSFSTVSQDVANQILTQNRPLYLYSGHAKRGSIEGNRKTDFIEVRSADETLRHAASLRFLDSIKRRLISKPFSIVQRDNDILARAEEVHHSIVEQLIHIFRNKGYSTFANEFVDLYAHNENKSFLFEVKSTENKNFRTQARKGIVQLFEYDYFEINKYKEENNLSFEEQNKILVPSRIPNDNMYINFINSLDLGVAIVTNNSVSSVGVDHGLLRI